MDAEVAITVVMDVEDLVHILAHILVKETVMVLAQEHVVDNVNGDVQQFAGLMELVNALDAMEIVLE
jgi:hypothetical protein